MNEPCAHCGGRCPWCAALRAMCRFCQDAHYFCLTDHGASR